MKDSINLIKQQANDSISYGERSGNVHATKKGEDLLKAVDKIDKFVNGLDKLIQLNDARSKAIDHLGEISVDKAVTRLSPDNYDTHEQWKAALDKFIGM